MPRAQTGRQESSEVGVVEQQNAQSQNQIIEEGVVAGDDDPNLQRENDPKQRDAEGARQQRHPNQDQLEAQREGRGAGVKPMREMLRVPGDPGGQRAILVIVVHGGEIAPFRIAAGDFGYARLEVDG